MKSYFRSDFAFSILINITGLRLGKYILFWFQLDEETVWCKKICLNLRICFKNLTFDFSSGFIKWNLSIFVLGFWFSYVHILEIIKLSCTLKAYKILVFYWILKWYIPLIIKLPTHISAHRVTTIAFMINVI